MTGPEGYVFAVLRDVDAERARQVEKGHDFATDHEQGAQGVVDKALERLGGQSRTKLPENPAKARQLIVEAAAVLVAAAEVLDREAFQREHGNG